MNRGTLLIVIGGVVTGIGLGIVSAGVRASQGCVGCDDETTVDEVAAASAELAEDLPGGTGNEALDFAVHYGDDDGDDEG